MAPESQSSSGGESPATTPASQNPRGGRRPGRGHRGRGRRRKQKQPRLVSDEPKPLDAVASEAPEPAEPPFEGEPEERDLEPGSAPVPPSTFGELAEEPEPAEPDYSREEPEPTERPEPPPSAPPASATHPARPVSSTSVQKAIEEVSDVVTTLREALDEMEDVLEMLEVFERQNTADEREIESLRRTLRHLQRPRDAGEHHRGHR